MIYSHSRKISVKFQIKGAHWIFNIFSKFQQNHAQSRLNFMKNLSIFWFEDLFANSCIYAPPYWQVESYPRIFLFWLISVILWRTSWNPPPFLSHRDYPNHDNNMSDSFNTVTMMTIDIDIFQTVLMQLDRRFFIDACLKITNLLSHMIGEHLLYQAIFYHSNACTYAFHRMDTGMRCCCWNKFAHYIHPGDEPIQRSMLFE